MIEARAQDDVAVLRLPSPILSTQLLGHLANALADAAADARPLVLASVHPQVFLAGADLGEIARLDWRDGAAYAARGRAIGAALARHPAPTVAAVHGGCLGGGVDLALACDGIVAAPNAFFRHPGAARGLLTGWGGSSRWPAAGGRRAAAALVHGRPVTAAAAHRAGWVIRLAEDPVAAAVDLARRWAGLAPPRLALWRCFRDGAFVDRLVSCVVHHELSLAADNARESS